MAVSKKAYEKIVEQAKRLPKAQRRDLVREISDAQNDSLESFIPKNGKVTKLGGLLRGHTFTEEDIAEARREMWGNLGKEPD